MTLINLKRLAGVLFILLIAVSVATARAETTSLEMDVAINEVAVLDVSVDDGTVEVVGGDVDHVAEKTHAPALRDDGLRDYRAT